VVVTRVVNGSGVETVNDEFWLRVDKKYSLYSRRLAGRDRYLKPSPFL
jgi:hypothetical protein